MEHLYSFMIWMVCDCQHHRCHYHLYKKKNFNHIYNTDNFKVQYWNNHLNAVTLDVILYPKELLDEIPRIQQVLYIEQMDLMLVLTVDGNILYLKVSELATSAELHPSTKFVAGAEAQHTTVILRFRKLTNQYINKEKNGNVAHYEILNNGTLQFKNEMNNTIANNFSEKRLRSLTDKSLLNELKALQDKLTPTIATQILNHIYCIEKEKDKLIYLQSYKYIYENMNKLQQVPREQAHFLLTKILQHESKEVCSESKELILQCCRLLSQFNSEYSSSTALPLEVLPLLVSEFKVDELWMMDACNLLIDTHFRSILSNKDMIAQLQKLREQVNLYQQIKETEAKLKGMIQAFANATPSKRRNQTNGVELINF
jgi:hypothetical protein